MYQRLFRIRAAVCVGLVVLGLVSAGCIRSRMRITSVPSGADVYINDVHYGRTPLDVPFIWYWHYKVELRKPGYENHVALERLRAPVYLIMPLDLIWEAMPFPIYDTKKLHYELYTQDRPSS
ncbi:MAG: hypothetical protein Kow0059_05010 [Candidatus Sumerlaeia bacterium]